MSKKKKKKPINVAMRAAWLGGAGYCIKNNIYYYLLLIFTIFKGLSKQDIK